MQTKWVRKSRVFSKTFFVLICLFLLITITATTFSFWIKSSLSPANPGGKEKVFVIKQNESVANIASNLQTEGLIKSSLVFRLYLKITCTNFTLTKPLGVFSKAKNCLGDNIQAGSFRLSPAMDVPKLASALTKGRLDSWVTLLEGWRNEEIAAVLARNYGIKEEDFLKVAREGYMFPDTYLFKVNSTAAEVADKMQSTFYEKVTPEIKSGFAKQGLSLEEGVTLASVVQREAGKSEDAAQIASVFLNRLNLQMPLGSDVTVQFALGYDATDKTWWKKDLTDQDLSINSPYNTRLVAGLPPGPICNPGLAALKAVADPAQTDYLYFLYDKKGQVHFAKTLQEHNQNKALYL